MDLYLLYIYTHTDRHSLPVADKAPNEILFLSLAIFLAAQDESEKEPGSTQTAETLKGRPPGNTQDCWLEAAP